MITKLEDHQVFVFGSNGTGFHGAGSAGYAMFHISGNVWRTTNVPGTSTTLDKVPNGTKGYWAVKGVSRGFQEGLHGKSYAIQTVTRPGMRRSVPLDDISSQLVELWRFAEEHTQLEFLMTEIGTGYSGYTRSEMASVFEDIMSKIGTPVNIRFHDYGKSTDVNIT